MGYTGTSFSIFNVIGILDHTLLCCEREAVLQYSPLVKTKILLRLARYPLRSRIPCLVSLLNQKSDLLCIWFFFLLHSFYLLYICIVIKPNRGPILYTCSFIFPGLLWVEICKCFYSKYASVCSLQKVSLLCLLGSIPMLTLGRKSKHTVLGSTSTFE